MFSFETIIEKHTPSYMRLEPDSEELRLDHGLDPDQRIRFGEPAFMKLDNQEELALPFMKTDHLGVLGWVLVKDLQLPLCTLEDIRNAWRSRMRELQQEPTMAQQEYLTRLLRQN